LPRILLFIFSTCKVQNKILDSDSKHILAPNFTFLKMDEAREQLLEEAYRLRDLGRYPEAHACFGKAREQADDLMLAVNIASAYMEGGNIKKCLEEINLAMEKFCTSTPDQVVVAIAKTLQASAVSSTTLRFHDSLKTGSELFDQHLRKLPIEKYDGKRVRSQS
jgi:tetratricopeptide (TPR) repeat protein